MLEVGPVVAYEAEGILGLGCIGSSVPEFIIVVAGFSMDACLVVLLALVASQASLSFSFCEFGLFGSALLAFLVSAGLGLWCAMQCHLNQGFVVFVWCW